MHAKNELIPPPRVRQEIITSVVHTVVPACTLCGAAAAWFHNDASRNYFRCGRCRLVFVDPSDWISREQERLRYDCHQNDPADVRYRCFLDRLFRPMRERLSAHSFGLDFGSGPGPTLSKMFSEIGHEMRIYDPFYAPDESVLCEQYDFITASEVVEHLHCPGAELVKLWSLLHVGGWLGIMTKRVCDTLLFETWHYKRDPTHVSFFALESFDWLAQHLHAKSFVVSDDVILFRKLPTTL
ncbi:MAG: class I SAM-dependent methyltransferase [Planctomycetota bacterium]|nr:class I SAM-dependent methyltransferase [Planctomycetota bacterium]MDA1179807.1 class I SAM-dependent methyltransferase [Planctomycetota bacterium]